MKQTIDYTEEKIALARELGLNECANSMAAIKAEVEEMTKVKFKPISENQLNRMIEKHVFRSLYHHESKTGFFVCLIVGSVVTALFGSLNLLVFGLKAALPTIYWLGGGTVLASTVAFCCASFPKCDRSVKNLSSWSDPLPRGALLAVKEARDTGLTDFEIHYPKIEDRRVLTDPVITGYKKGIRGRLMIHAWDDGKVHD